MRRPLRHPLILALLAPLACATADRGPTQAPAAAPASAPAQAVAQAPNVPQVSDDPVVQRVVELGHTDNRVQEHLRHLTEEIGPRLTSSHNLMRAEAWTRDQFKSWGLQAWLEQWGTVPVGFDRGPWSGGMVSPERVDYDFITRSWTPGHYDPKPAAAVAYPKTLAEAKANKDKYAGAWVVRPRRSGKDAPSEKTQAKIDGIMADAKVAGYIRPARNKEGLVHTGGSFRIDWNDLPKDVEVSLRWDQFEDLQKRVDAGQAVELSFSIDNRFFNGPVPQHNVIADIPGTEKPDEYVIVGGHLDSWDGAVGAVDNGTGVSTTLEAARLLMAAGARPKRTIRFMLWGGEEQGLHGSKGYVEQHPELMSKISTVLVHDGGTNYLAGIRVTPDMRAQVDQVFEPIMKLNPDLPFEIGHADGLQTGGSDHTPFIRAGVPGFFWVQDGRSDYNHMHHTQHDTFATAIPEYQRHSAMVVAIAAYNFANLDGLLERRNSAPIPRRTMGIEMDGMKLKSVAKDSLAAKAGLKAGDQILEVAGVSADDRRAMWRAMRDAGDSLVVKVKRRGKTVEATIDFSQHEGEKERARRRKEWTEKYGTTYESDRPANAARDAAKQKKAKAPSTATPSGQ